MLVHTQQLFSHFGIERSNWIDFDEWERIHDTVLMLWQMILLIDTEIYKSHLFYLNDEITQWRNMKTQLKYTKGSLQNIMTVNSFSIN